MIPWGRLTFLLAQSVRDFDLPSIRVWHSHHGCPGSACTWFRFPTEYPSLTLSPRLSWLSMYVISISYRISESDTLTTLVLAQPVRDFDFLQDIRVWHSHHGCPCSGCTWFRFPTEYSTLTLSPRLSWLRLYVISISNWISDSDTLTTVVLAQPVRDFDFQLNIRVWHSPRLSWLRVYVISISYWISESDTLTTVVLAQVVRDFDFLLNIRVWHSHHGFPGSVCTWFRFPTEYSTLTLSPRLSWLSMYVISISYRIFESDTLTTVVLAQHVRDFDFSQNIQDDSEIIPCILTAGMSFQRVLIPID